MGSAAALDAIALLRAGVGELVTADMDGLSGLEVAGLVEALEVERRRLDAVDARVLAEVERRGVAGEFGRTSTADLLAVRCRVDVREAKERVSRAASLGPRSAVSGEALEPLLPATSSAIRTGDISSAHARVIADTMERIDHLDCAAEAAGPVERFLVEAACHEDPRALRRTAALVVLRLNPDGDKPAEQENERHRTLTIVRRPDGSIVISGRLTPTCAAVWEPILDTLSAPGPAGDGMIDDRRPAQRRHDGFEEAALRLLRSGSLPDSGGVPVTVLATTTADNLNKTAGTARTAHGDIIGLRRIMTLADSDIRYTVLTITGEVLHHGRAKRRATPSQRRALASRDGGCCFPGCTRPAAWTEAHHIVTWLDGGPTDIDNLCLVCPFHHRLLDHGDWHVTMISGRPHWLPPPWLDRERTPVRNTANHLPDIDFGRGDVDEQPDTG